MDTRKMWEDLGSTLFWWIFFSCESFSPESLLGSRNLSGWSQTPLNVTYNYKVFLWDWAELFSLFVRTRSYHFMILEGGLLIWIVWIYNTLFQVRPLAKEKTENKTNSFGNFIAKPQRESLNYFSNPDNSTKMLWKKYFWTSKIISSIGIY